jgi:UDP:flavonoid glycosyltransferase YjiC (YdhE family)
MDDEVPSNVHLGGFVPFERLQPLTDILVTNAGYSGVHTAPRHGVQKLRRRRRERGQARSSRPGRIVRHRNQPAHRPSRGAALRASVEKVLMRPGYRERARQLRTRFQECRPFDVIAEIVEQA